MTTVLKLFLFPNITTKKALKVDRSTYTANYDEFMKNYYWFNSPVVLDKHQ